MSFEWIDPFAEHEQQQEDARRYVARLIEDAVGPDYERELLGRAMNQARRDAQEMVARLRIPRRAQQIIEAHMESAIRAVVDLEFYNLQPTLEVHIGPDSVDFLGVQRIAPREDRRG